MKSQILFAAGMTAVAVAVVAGFFFTIERRDAIPSVESAFLETEEVEFAVDIDAEFSAEPIITDTPSVPEIVMIPLDTIELDFSNVNCAAVMGGKAMVGTEGGIFIYDPVETSIELVSIYDGLIDPHVTALCPNGDRIYIGTRSGLFLRDENGNVEQIAPDLKVEITAIAAKGNDIYIGTTTDGVIKISPIDTTVILSSQNIRAIEVGGSNVWIAAYDDGLYCYDGVKCRRRSLISDSTALDCVSSLGFKFDRLYVGTSEGMYVYDGGCWDMYDGDDGLLVCDVTAITFKGWKILAGTRDWGYFEIFEEWVRPMAWSEALEVTALASDGNLVVLGTPDNGAYIATEDDVRHVNPDIEIFEIPQFALFF